ncbi:MAG: hypothetical protein A3J58_02380 [Candidatus Sungbacteria bacterium RIFCSPHIGHO2_02_FULL_52_23]|uniref:Uncharacterized protein n=1 Tax=Candidatus Sungbacteria bacterium RIFCSPHIGHO2_02_FULL_52_23 TaxID=1802274 RepID=A0A1G2KZJ8_9BACT|nr:MAG: hypothetical protein A3J58_02380 [Candidatus Sungbacteria bacterium RIFCSPHIGHO2_02_FULL_52_23]
MEEEVDNLRLRQTFTKQFNFPWDGFTDPVNFSDSIGFFIFKADPKKEGFTSLFKIYIKNNDLDNAAPLKSIIISASYGKSEKGGVVAASTAWKRGKFWPIDLISEGDFFYDVEKNKFYLDRNRAGEISGSRVLQIVDQWHIKPTKKFAGLWLRIKLLWFHMVLTSAFRFLFWLFAWLQYFISGESVHIYAGEEEWQRHAESKVLHVSKEKPINIFGYEVQQWIAVLYCMLYLIAYILFYRSSYRPSVLIGIFKNNFLTLAYVIFSLGLANTILPSLLKPTKTINQQLLKILQHRYGRYAFKQIKI